MKKVIFKRIRGRIIPIIQKVVGQRKPNARKILRATASARTSLSNKRIGAIKAVREAKFKRKQAKSIIHKLERKEIVSSKIRGHNQRKMDAIVNAAEKQLSQPKKLRKIANSMEMRRKGKGYVDIDPKIDYSMTEEQMKRVVRGRAYQQAQKTPEYKRLDAINSKMNKVYNRNQNIMSTIENKGMPSGATAKTTILKNKVVKTDNDLHGMIESGEHLGIADRAKLSILLSKKNLTPETFLVRTSKKDYKVSERLKTARWSETERREKSILGLEKKIRKEGVIPLDTHFENLGKVGESYRVIDTGQFKIDRFDFMDSEKALKRLNKFIINSNKRRK